MQRTVPHWENTRAFRDYDAWKTSAPEPQGVCPVCDADFWPDGDGGCAECAERQIEDRSRVIGAFLTALPPERARRFWQRMFQTAREEIAAQKQRRAMREEGA